MGVVVWVCLGVCGCGCIGVGVDGWVGVIASIRNHAFKDTQMHTYIYSYKNSHDV